MTAEVTPLPVATLLKGDTLPPFALTLDRDDVRAYLEATGEPAERWGEVVPPLMLVARMIGGLLQRIEIPDRLLHTGQEFAMARALRAGEPVEVRFAVTSLSVRQGALLAAFSLEAHADDGVVASARTSVLVPPAADAEAAP